VGFYTRLVYVSTDDVEQNIQRVARRVLDGGHGAPVERLREIYRSSLANLHVALPAFDEVFLYDSGAYATQPRLVRTYLRGTVVSDFPPPPRWLVVSLV
jgi:predicted ABC-type ATPase